MLNRIICSICLICCLVSFSGCATIVTGRTQHLPVTSQPSGAIVTINGQKQMTPATFILDRKQELYVVRVEKEGYSAVEVTLRKGMNGWVWGNILFGLIGGAIGLTIDISNGAVNKFTPSKVDVNLTQEQLAALKQKGDVLFIKLVQS